MYHQLYRVVPPIKKFFVNINAITVVPTDWHDSEYNEYTHTEETYCGIRGRLSFSCDNFPRYKGYAYFPHRNLFIETTFLQLRGYLVPVFTKIFKKNDHSSNTFECFLNYHGFLSVLSSGYRDVGFTERYPEDEFIIPFLSKLIDDHYEYYQDPTLMENILLPSLETKQPLPININRRMDLYCEFSHTDAEMCSGTLIRETESFDPEYSSLGTIIHEIFACSNNVPSEELYAIIGKPIHVGMVDYFNSNVITYVDYSKHCTYNTSMLTVKSHQIHSIICQFVKFAYSYLYDSFTYHAYITNGSISSEKFSYDVSYPIINQLKTNNNHGDLTLLMNTVYRFFLVMSEHYRFNGIKIVRYPNDLFVIELIKGNNVVKAFHIDMLTYMYMYFI